HRAVREGMDPPARRGPAAQAGPPPRSGDHQMKIAIPGLGSIGRRHLGNFRIAGVEALTAYEAAPAQREAAAKDFPFATIVTSAAAGLEGADGAVICPPPESHPALGRLAAERGAHLMVEKPFAQSGEGVEELLKLCDTKGLKVLTAYNWRYWPPMLLVEKLLKEGRIGAIRAASPEYAYHLTP